VGRPTRQVAIHPSVTMLAADALARVRARILRAPTRYDQQRTQTCIGAKLAVVLELQRDEWMPFWVLRHRAEHRLGLAHNKLANLTAGVDFWPRGFADRWWLAENARDRARVAADRIDHFVQTGE
jgi:hypothetical protein